MADDGTGHESTEDVVVRRLEGFPAVLRTRADGTLALEAADGSALPALTPGERLHVTRAVHGDASYRTPARVVRVQPDDGVVEVHRAGDQQRDQQRRAVRVRTTAIEAVLTPGVGSPVAGEVLDLSASGVRILLERGAALPVGTDLTTHVELPRRRRSDLSFRLDGEVVWTRTLDDGREAVGVEFHHADESVASRLTRWVWDVETSRIRGADD